MARPCSPAQESSATALVPPMSDLNPPSQNRPGEAALAHAYGNPPGGGTRSNLDGFQAKVDHSLRAPCGKWF